MAVSCLEQRFMPLVDSVHFWKPWGPGVVAPVLYPKEAEVESVAGDLIVTRRMGRSHSWGGYTTYSQQIASSAPDIYEGHKQFLKKPGTPMSDDGQVITSTSAPSTPMLLGNVKNKKWADHRSARIVALKPGESTACQTVFAHATSGKSPKSLKSPKAKGRQSLKESISSSPVGSDRSLSHEGTTNRGSLSPRGPIVSGQITTLMIRNLPRGLTQRELLETVDNCGYAGLYDFCYLPYKFATHRNLGFAFLNFVSTDVAATFWRQWHLSCHFNATLNVSAAAVQGSRANEEKAASKKMSRVRNPCYMPIVFENTGDKASMCASECLLSHASPRSPVTPLQQWKGQLLTHSRTSS